MKKIRVRVLLQFLKNLTVVEFFHDLGPCHVKVLRSTEGRPKEDFLPLFSTVVFLNCLLHDLLAFLSVILGIWPFLIVLIEDIEGEEVGEVPKGDGGDNESIYLFLALPPVLPPL